PRLRFHGPPHDVRLNRQFAPPAVDKYAEINAGGASEVRELVEGGAGRAPRVGDVIHDHHHAPVDPARRQPRFAHDGTWTDGHEIVPVERNVQRADGRALALVSLDLHGYPLVQRYAPPLDPPYHQVLRTLVPLLDLTGHARQRTLDRPLIHEELSCRLAHRFRDWGPVGRGEG